MRLSKPLFREYLNSLCLLIVVVVYGCRQSTVPVDTSSVSKLPPGPTAPSEFIGTWQWYSWIRSGDPKTHLVEQPFFIQFAADGTSYQWPAPLNQMDPRPKMGVNRGDYRIAGGRLHIDSTTSCAIRVQDGVLSYDGVDGVTCVYHRVADLAPGSLP
jgi:hypothetical protein